MWPLVVTWRYVKGAGEEGDPSHRSHKSRMTGNWVVTDHRKIKAKSQITIKITAPISNLTVRVYIQYSIGNSRIIVQIAMKA